MSAAIMGFALVTGEIRQLPKFGLTLEEICFAYGSEDLVKSLRKVGALVPAKNYGRTLIFDAGQAAMVWAQYLRGDHDERLQGLKG